MLALCHIHAVQYLEAV